MLAIAACFSEINGQTRLVSGVTQTLPESRQSSFYTYVFKMSEKESARIFRKDLWEVDYGYFHTLVDSFTTGEEYNEILPQGHYLMVWARQDKLQVEIYSVQNFETRILNNKADLNVQVTNPAGEPIAGAKVKLGGKKLAYDKKTKTYRLKKSNRKGLLTVEYDGFTAYHRLERQYNNSRFKRTYQAFLYRTPVKYIWNPARTIVRLPYDGVRSLIAGHSRGSVWTVRNFFSSLFQSREEVYKGFITFNKPMYKPADTVKLKAFILDKHARPVKKSLDLVLYKHDRKNIRFRDIRPYRPGGYEYEFALADSMNLRLDNNYHIQLEDENKNQYISGSFRYEDYELTKSEFSVRTLSSRHFKGGPFVLFFKANDENGLNLPDARVKIMVESAGAVKLFQDKTFIPDVLWSYEQTLDMAGETRFEIPDSVFPPASLNYKINLTLMTADNEKKERSLDAMYLLALDELRIRAPKDSVIMEYLHNGESKPAPAVISLYNKTNSKLKELNVSLPCKLPLEPQVYKYALKFDTLVSEFLPSSDSDLIQCYSEVTADSLHILIYNPRKIPFNYFIYKRNNEIERGTAVDLNFHRSVNPTQKFFVSLQYVWGGETKDVDYEIPFYRNQVKLELITPRMVYPGQTVEIKVKATAANGKPVSGMDITAQAITKKFQNAPQNVPYLGKTLKNRTLVNEFHFNANELTESTRTLQKEWVDRMGLDTIAYYKFIFPDKQLYKVELGSQDKATQFAPFVVHKGAIQPIHIVYVDHEPVYFSWTSPQQPYSFKTSFGKHHVMLRTLNNLITIREISFGYGKKTLFVVDETLPDDNVIIEDRPVTLTENEKRNLSRYMFPYRNNDWGKLAFIRQQDRFFILNPDQDHNNNLTGPVKPSQFSFNIIDEYQTSLTHEPFFEYDLIPGLVRMRSTNRSNVPNYFPFNTAHPSFSDETLTEESVERLWEEHIKRMRFTGEWFQTDHYTSEGAGTLQLSYRSDVEKPLNYVLLKTDKESFLKIYPGNKTVFYNLPAGFYRLASLFDGDRYYITDSVEVKGSGCNHYRIARTPDLLEPDSFSINTSKIIIEKVLQPYQYRLLEKTDEQKVFTGYFQANAYTGEGRMVTGRVTDYNGEGLPGVTVTVKGTIIGTVSDMNGFYSIIVPDEKYVLVFSYIGFVSEEINMSGSNALDVKLSEDVKALSEIVVIGYGVQSKQSLTASVATMQTGMQGAVPGIMIRGISTAGVNREPLYIIDGVIVSAETFSKLEESQIRDMEVLKDSMATAVYGSRAANGVILINTKSGNAGARLAMQMMGFEYDSAFFSAAGSSGSIRNNFSDYAIWQPRLTTNENGEASFTVKFPDDVTNWRTFIYAIDDKKRSGQLEKEIKSFKPLMAQLALPIFLVSGDTVNVIGKTMNYTADSVDLVARFEVDKQLVLTKNRRILHSAVDSCRITDNQGDSLSIKYYIEKPDGYFDGEERKIQVMPLGMETGEGQFLTLDQDTTLTLSFNESPGETYIYIRADLVDILLEEAERTIHYRYLCNEQLASKLKALLAKKKVHEALNKKFEDENKINDIIRRLKKNQKSSGLWGWWESSEASYWISLHAIEALIEAEKAGYDAGLEHERMIEYLVWQINTETGKDKLRLLNLLDALKAEVNFEKHIAEIEKQVDLSLSDKFSLIELRQKYELRYSLDSLMKYRKTTLFGNIYYGQENNDPFLVNDNHILATLTAYRILRNEGCCREDLRKIRNFFLESRREGYWRNTYESSLIVENILSDILKEKGKVTPPLVSIEGDIRLQADSFPFSMKAENIGRLQVSKSGDAPVYFTAYRKAWISNPAVNDRYFTITTALNGEDSTAILKAGQPVKLKVHLRVKKKADFVMLEVPIPAGCSYEKKLSWNAGETYREYFKTHTSIFIEHLKEGAHEFNIDLLPRYSGSYTLNPAKAELMYFPVFYGNEKVKRVWIE